MIPRDKSCIPPKKQTVHKRLAHPETVLPAMLLMIAHNILIKPPSETIKPTQVIICIDLTERLVMPSHANASILWRG